MSEESEEMSIEDALTQAFAEQEEAAEETSEPEEAPAEAAAEPEPEFEPELEPEPEPEAAETATAPKSQPPVGAPLEDWDAVPEKYKTWIQERERHVAQTLQSTAQQRRVGEQFSQLTQQYAPVIAAEGISDPIQGVKGLLDSVAGLRMGNAQQKAQIAANMLMSYEVDPGLVADALQGQLQPANTDPRIEQVLRQNQELMGRINDAQNSANQNALASAEQEIAAFAQDPQNKYFDRVSPVVAQFIGNARQNGKTMTLKEAYDMACMMDPEISQIISRERLTSQQPVVQRKKAAAASLNGRQSGDGAQENSALSIRDALLQGLEAQ